MYTISSLLSMPVKSLFDEVFSPNPEVWGALSDADLNDISLRCDTHWVQAKWLHSPELSLLLSFVLALAGIGAAFAETAAKLVLTVPVTTVLSFALSVVMATLLTWGGLAVAFGLFMSVSGLYRLEWITEQLIPLRDAPYTCASTLECLERSASARAYRDVVVASARELRVVDATVIQNLDSEDKRKRRELDQAATCREVHAIA